MKRKEYEQELIHLYIEAKEMKDTRLAFELLEAGRIIGLDSFTDTPSIGDTRIVNGQKQTYVKFMDDSGNASEEWQR
jgi:hypothetical protein